MAELKHSVKNRCLALDQLKGVAIILVILAHTIQFITNRDGYTDDMIFNGINSFHMPFFMIISGFLFSYSGKWTYNFFFRKRIIQLLLPFFTWAFMDCLFIKPLTVHSFVELIRNPGLGLWFLWVLFWVNAVERLCNYICCMLDKKKNAYIIIYVMAWVFLFLLNRILGSVAANYLVFFHFPFYCLGIILDRLQIVKNSK